MTTPDTNTSIDGEKSDGFLTEPDKDPENQSTNSQVDAEKDAASDSPAPLQSAHDTTPAAAPMSLLQTATLMLALCVRSLLANPRRRILANPPPSCASSSPPWTSPS
jgi:hypothetical protein